MTPLLIASAFFGGLAVGYLLGRDRWGGRYRREETRRLACEAWAEACSAELEIRKAASS